MPICNNRWPDGHKKNKKLEEYSFSPKYHINQNNIVCSRFTVKMEEKEKLAYKTLVKS